LHRHTVSELQGRIALEAYERQKAVRAIAAQPPLLIGPDPVLLNEREKNREEIARLTQANKALASENNELRRQLDEQTVIQRSMESDLAQMKEQRAVIDKEVQTLRKENERLLGKEKKAFAAYEERLAEIAAWKRETEELRRKISKLEQCKL
jgi:chromosome segregation ATPase